MGRITFVSSDYLLVQLREKLGMLLMLLKYPAASEAWTKGMQLIALIGLQDLVWQEISDSQKNWHIPGSVQEPIFKECGTEDLADQRVYNIVKRKLQLPGRFCYLCQRDTIKFHNAWHCQHRSASQSTNQPLQKVYTLEGGESINSEHIDPHTNLIRRPLWIWTFIRTIRNSKL